MELRDKYLNWGFKEAAIQQTTADYIKQGYVVTKEASIGKHVVDLLVTKGDINIVFEFKSGQWTKAQANRVSRLRNYVVHEIDAQFKLVLLNIPQKKEIYIEDLDIILFSVINDDANLYDQLATHVYPDVVTDIDADYIYVDNDHIEIKGSAYINFDLQYGSDGDWDRGDGVRSSDSFPLTFRITLDHELKLDEVLDIDIDLSSYYE